MPLTKYGVLKGHAVERKPDRNDSTPHFQVRVDDGRHHYRLYINVTSKKPPSELLYMVDEDFNHPITSEPGSLSRGFTQLGPMRSPVSLDYIRGNLFDRSQMQLLPHDVPGPDNDLNEKIDTAIQQAIYDGQTIGFDTTYRLTMRVGENIMSPEALNAKVLRGQPWGESLHESHRAGTLTWFVLFCTFVLG